MNFLRIQNLFYGLFFLIQASHFNYIFSIYSSKAIEKEQLSVDYFQNSFSNEYILGAGDSIRITVSRVFEDINTKDALVDVTGHINLPLVKRIYVSGLTINELSFLLQKKYAEFVNNPAIEVSINRYRPLNLFIKGEVNNPGLHIMNYERNKTFITLFEALQEAEGITNNADLTNIQVIRKDTISNGGGSKVTNLNLLDYINTGNNEQNIRLFSDDIILIKKSSDEILSQVSKAIRSNINPSTIEIYVTGRVENPGLIKVKKLSSLNDAIKISGDIKSLSGKIKLIRYESDGSKDERKFKYSPGVERGNFKNPILRNGDIIFIGKGAFINATNILSEIAKPFRDIVSTYSLIKIINE